MTIKPTAGFIYIIPNSSDNSFVMPEEKGVIRMGKVMGVGSNIWHTSGKELNSPCRVGDVVAFTYMEDEDVKVNGKDHYLVSFNRICAIYD